jgi:integrase
MERKTHRLTAKQLEGAEDGWHADGGNLFLRVADGGTRRHWVLRWTRDGKTTEMGLGGADRVSLALARQKRDQAMQQISNGLDPISERRKAKDARASRKTFSDTAQAVIAADKSGWRTGVDGRTSSLTEWTKHLMIDCKPIASKFVDEIDVNDVKRIVSPHWDRNRHATARRLLSRIRRTLAYAKSHGWRSGDNPASWEVFQDIAPKTPNGETRHHAAMPWRDVPDFMRRLREVEGMSALALEFAILTATRSGEARGAKWSEIDSDAGVWIVPAERMKRKDKVRFDVPLSRQAMDLLRKMPKAPSKASDGFIFPGANPGRPLNNGSFYDLMGRLTGGGATTHGFRSSFRDWCGDHGVERELAELSLGHAFGSAVETAYARSSLIERRRPIMQKWADHLDGESDSAKVVPLKRA